MEGWEVREGKGIDTEEERRKEERGGEGKEGKGKKIQTGSYYPCS